MITANPTHPKKRTITLVADSTLAADIYSSHCTKIRGGLQTAVMVHGFGGDRAEGGLFPALAKAVACRIGSVVTYDCRGLGESGGSYGDSRMSDHVDDLAAVMQYVRGDLGSRPQSTVLIGFSLGAAVIGSYIRQYTRPGGLVYLSPACRPALSMWPRYQRAWNEIEQGGCFIKPGTDVELRAPILETLRDTDLGTRCFDVGQTPLLVCHGNKDQRIPIAHTRRAMQSTGPRVRFEELEGASHSYKTRRSRAQVVKTVADWISELSSTRSRRS